MKKVYIFITFISICSICYSQQNLEWYVQNTQINHELYSVFFTDSLNGWICGDQIIIKTTDAGYNWEFVNSSTKWSEIFFLNDSVGLVAGSHSIAKSYDGGNTWSTKYHSNYREIFDLCFLDTLIGFAVGGYNTILKTTNSGESWYATNPPPVASFFVDASFINDSIGWVSGFEDVGGPIRGLIAKTTDTGENWFVAETFNYPEISIPAILFFDQNFGFCSSGRKLFETTDGGMNWILRSTMPDNALDLVLHTDSSIWAVGGGIHYSKDLGLSWETSFSDSVVFARKIYFIKDDLGWAVGDNLFNTGYILTTNKNIVVTADNEKSNFNTKTFILGQNYPNPFNPSTKIRFVLPQSALGNTQEVTLKVYDILGTEVVTLLNEELSAGEYEVEFSAIGGSASGGDADKLTSGVYFYQLSAGNFVDVKKMVLLR